jgi:hypothetical protein
VTLEDYTAHKEEYDKSDIVYMIPNAGTSGDTPTPDSPSSQIIMTNADGVMCTGVITVVDGKPVYQYEILGGN